MCLLLISPRYVRTYRGKYHEVVIGGDAAASRLSRLDPQAEEGAEELERYGKGEERIQQVRLRLSPVCFAEGSLSRSLHGKRLLSGGDRTNVMRTPVMLVRRTWPPEAVGG